MRTSLGFRAGIFSCEAGKERCSVLVQRESDAECGESEYKKQVKGGA